jgi:hypothetical protein
MKKLFKIDDFGAGCFGLILIGMLVIGFAGYALAGR